MRANTYVEREAKDAVHVLHEADGVRDLSLDLRVHAKDVRIILLEAAHSRETREGTAELVAVQDAKVGEANRQLTVGPGAVLEHDAVTGAVHGLERKLLVLGRQAEHVVLVVLPMARRLEELLGVDVGRHDLREATSPVLLLWRRQYNVSKRERESERARERERIFVWSERTRVSSWSLA